jgi:hypothetical protein
MDDGPRLRHRSRDESCHNYNLSDAIYGMFPSRATDTSVRRSRAPSPSESIRKSKAMDSVSPLSIKLTCSTVGPNWLPQSQRTRLQTHQMELHQSTCLNLNMASGDNTESDLWILPDFDDWELESDPPQQASTKNEGEWAPLLRRAASSNRERLRARLEGDGWDFVGGKYGQEERPMQDAVIQVQDCVDDEFDVVVLPAAQLSC